MISVANILDTFFDPYARLSYKKGDHLIKPDNSIRGVTYLKRGIVRMYSLSAHGEEFTLNLFKPPAFFPMTVVLTTLPNKYYYQALTNCECRTAPIQETFDFVKNNPTVMLDLLQRVYRGMHGLITNLEHLMGSRANNRLINLLLILAQRFGKIELNQTIITLALSHQQLASLAGLSRESVSRELRKLKDKNLIKYHSNYLAIANLHTLKAELV